MPLRDFDRVRERIVLRLEVRHIVRFVLAILGLAGACFFAGYRVGQDTVPPPVARKVVRLAAPTGAPVRTASLVPTPEPELPVVPRPLAPPPVPLAPQPDAVLHALAVPNEAIASAQERELPRDPPAPVEKPAAVEPPADKPADQPVLADERAEKPKPPQVLQPQRPALVLARTALTQPWPGLGFLRAVPPPPRPQAVAASPRVAPPHRVVPAAPAQPSTPHGIAGERYVIQIKAFRNEAEATAFQQQLLAHGYHTTLSTIEVPDKGTFYRVRLGPFPTVEQAKAAQRKFEQAEGHATIILVVAGSVAPATPAPAP